MPSTVTLVDGSTVVTTLAPVEAVSLLSRGPAEANQLVELPTAATPVYVQRAQVVSVQA